MPECPIWTTLVGSASFLISVWLVFDLPHLQIWCIVRTYIMKCDHARDFACPRCQARYRIVRMQSDPGVVYGMVQCMVCDQSLAPIENEYILK